MSFLYLGIVILCRSSKTLFSLAEFAENCYFCAEAQKHFSVWRNLVKIAIFVQKLKNTFQFGGIW
jgi:hypothetical protein